MYFKHFKINNMRVIFQCKKQKTQICVQMQGAKVKGCQKITYRWV